MIEGVCGGAATLPTVEPREPAAEPGGADAFTLEDMESLANALLLGRACDWRLRAAVVGAFCEIETGQWPTEGYGPRISEKAAKQVIACVMRAMELDHDRVAQTVMGWV